MLPAWPTRSRSSMPLPTLPNQRRPWPAACGKKFKFMETTATEAEEKHYAKLQHLALDFARNGETEHLASMLRHRLPVNLADAKGNSLLMLASYHGEVETAQMLLEHGADVDHKNDRGQTPLGGAAFKGYEKIVALLQAHGASLTLRNRLGISARFMTHLAQLINLIFGGKANHPVRTA